MKKYIIKATNHQYYLVIADNENEAKIKFTLNLPSYKIHSVEETHEDMFNVII